MSQPYTSSSSAKQRQQSEMYSSAKSIGGDVDDLKDASNYEALFDSGYNSNVQSKTFIDEADIESMHCSTDAANDDSSRKGKSHPAETSKEAHSKTNVQQWSDSGVCITDSGLSITEDDHFETSQLDSETSSKAAVEPVSDLPRRWLQEQNSEGDTLLHLAIIEDMEEIACSIIQNIPSSSDLLNSFNYLYQTPLHLAVLKRQMTVIKDLVSRGVSMAFQDSQGNTPLHIACKYSLTDILCYFLMSSHKTLLSSNCFELRNYDGDTCVHLAAYNNNLKALEMILHSGANVNVQEGRCGKTILHWAAENSNLQLVTFLLKKCNPDVSVRTFSGQTALHVAWKANLSLKHETSNDLKSKSNKIVNLLLERSGEESKISLESLYTDSESDYTSDEE